MIYIKNTVVKQVAAGTTTWDVILQKAPPELVSVENGAVKISDYAAMYLGIFNREPLWYK